MSLEEELDALIGGLTRLRTTAHQHRTNDVTQGIHQLTARIEQLHKEIQDLTERMVDATARQAIDIQGQFVDLIGIMNRQSAIVTAIAEKIDTGDSRSSDDAAVQALIVTHDQLGRIAAASSDEAAAIAGQCANLELTLAQLGVAPVDATPNGSFDPAVMISETQTAPTDDAELDGRVAQQIRTGWRKTSDGMCIRVARVRVYAHTPATEGAVVAPPGGHSDGPVPSGSAADSPVGVADGTTDQDQLAAGEPRG